ncbi:MAG: phospholipid carrier-dependent glycosyltransferase [Fimbriimonadaceae bacterium]|nr:phospholipid carrier-dependent glycosyltransferase [Fimbriimonadaceae bacterium]
MPHDLLTRFRLWVSDQSLASRVFWVVVLVAAFFRFRWLNQVPTQPVTDFAWYFDRATEMARGMDYQVDGKPTAYWPVGYPGFLSLLFRLTGPSVEAARLANASLSTIVVLLSGLTVKRMTANRWIAPSVMVVLAFHPAWIAYGGILASEPLYTTLILIGLWQFPRFGRGHALVSGAAFGLATLVRPQAILIPILLVGIDFIRLVWSMRSTLPNLSFNIPEQETRLHDSPTGTEDVSIGAVSKPKKHLFALAIVLFCAFAPPVAWSVRNISAIGGFAFVSTNGGDNLWIGATGEGRYKRPEIFSPDEIQQDKLAQKEGLRIIKSNPKHWLKLAPEKLRQTFLSGSDAPYWAFQIEPNRLITPGEGKDKEQFKSFRERSNAWPPALVAFALLGLFIRPRNSELRVDLTYAALVIGMTALLSVAFFGNPRFGLPATPFLALLAVLPFFKMAESLRVSPSNQDGGSQNGDASPTIL